jgi:DNA polymerase alpha subunit B
MFEGGFEEGAPYRVRLDLCEIPQYYVFPGQVLGVQGKNTRGFSLRASSLQQAPPLPPRHLARTHLTQLTSAADLKQTGIMYANGPFMLSDSMSDAPLADLLAEFQRTRPSALILCGPFVDEKAPPVATCSLGFTYEALQNSILQRIATEVLPHAHLVLVPALRDVAHVPVFPQPPFEIGFEVSASLRHRLHLLPNPCVFTIADTSFALSSEDILRHLSASTLHR